MSKGMYCSASQWIDSASSSWLIWGRLIFLTMTALPETLVATSFVLILWALKRRWIASITAPESMMAPSTIASGGSGSMPMFTSWYSAPPLPPGFSSTALTAEEPMSRPTSPFFFRTEPREPPLCRRLSNSLRPPLTAPPGLQNGTVDEIRTYDR